MVFNIEVNNEIIQAKKGETILTALKRNGIRVPTLCNMKSFTPTGACRMCIVEVEGKENLIPSCSFQVEEWMKIKTHSPRVLKARKTIVELLLSNHPDDCLYCERNGNCELQKLAEDLNVRERRIPGGKSRHKIDKSGIGIIRDPAKCLLCGRCVRICEEQQAVSTLDFTRRGSSLVISTAMDKALNFSNCINCGQCVISCPTGALTERVQFSELDQVLSDHKKKVVVQYSSTLSAALTEEFGLKAGQHNNGIINSLFRKMGFDFVFDTSFAADLLVMEQAKEFISRYESGENLPLITSSCPAWIKYVEQSMPELLPHLSALKSPQQIMGSAIKSYYSELKNYNPEEIYSVSVTHCTAGKYEASKPEMTQRGIPDIDLVLTLREIIRMIRLHGIDLDHLKAELPDEPMGAMTSAGKLCGVGGGSLEALLRTVYFRLTNEELDNMRLSKMRTHRVLKEMNLKVGNKDLKIAAVSGIREAVKLLNEVKSGKKNYHIIEVMACSYGCVNGGGQPISHEENIIRNRAKAIYDFDNKDMIKVAHRNPQVIRAYEEYFGTIGSEKAKELLFTNFSKKEVLL